MPFCDVEIHQKKDGLFSVKLDGHEISQSIGGRRKVCVNDKIREYEKVRLSQEWKQEPIQEGVEEK